MRRFGEGEEIKGLDKMERKGFLNLELLRQKSNTYKMQDARSEYCEMSQKFRGRSHWKRTLILIDYDRSRGQTCFCHFRKMSRHRFDRLFFSDSQACRVVDFTSWDPPSSENVFMPQRCEWHFRLKHIIYVDAVIVTLVTWQKLALAQGPTTVSLKVEPSRLAAHPCCQQSSSRWLTFTWPSKLSFSVCVCYSKVLQWLYM